MIKSFDVKEQFGKKHGKINDDSEQWTQSGLYIYFFITYSLSDHFSSFQLSSDGSKLLYIAEKKVPESVSYFKRNIGMKAGMHNCFFI